MCSLECGRPFSGSVAIESSDFAYVVDPSGDGDNWTVESSSDAIGGSTLVAPAGARVTLPGTHDAIVTFNLDFSEAGTYTAYYRARGFNGSSDSFYTPSDFGVDPDNQESISNNGVYGWETGQTYEVTSGDIGTSLDFRIGKREADAELDAFVFHLNANLTDAELNALFA
jgi:hypothetical protein